MTTYPLATLSPTIDSTGINSPSYSDIYLSLVASFKAIYGSDIYLTADSQDGQMLGVFAKAIYDSNQLAVAVFQSFSPSYSQGAPLSSLVKINGLTRNVSTYSTAVGTLIGTVGSTIINGVVQDSSGLLWSLPSSVTVPIGGSITVTVTCQKTGAINAATGAINKIVNPQLGWQSFINTSAATAGAAVESDAALKKRQSTSTSMPAQTVLDSILAAVSNLTGVTRYAGYDNSTGATDANGIPAHSMAIVVLGGTSSSIAGAIALKKMPGAQTYGSTSVITYDRYGLPTTINYFILAQTAVYFAFTIKALAGYVSTTGALIISTLVSFVNSLAIGEGVYMTQALSAAGLINSPLGQTFSIQVGTFFLGASPSPTLQTDVAIAFNAAAVCSSSNVALTVI